MDKKISRFGSLRSPCSRRARPTLDRQEGVDLVARAELAIGAQNYLHDAQAQGGSTEDSRLIATCMCRPKCEAVSDQLPYESRS